MAGTNDFKALATGGGANVLTQAEYAALTSLIASGFQSGVADSKQINKVFRQGSVMASAIGTIIANANLNALDDGDVAALANTLLTVFQRGGYFLSASGGTANAITGSYSPAITALTDGMTLKVRPSAANTSAAPTFTPNSGVIAAKAIVKGAGSALSAGDIAGAGHWLEMQYDATLDKWVLLNPAKGVNTSISSKDMAAFPNTSGTDTYTVTLGLTAYTDGQPILVHVTNANTSATPTLNCDTLGAKTIVLQDGTSPVAGQIVGPCIFMYDFGLDKMLLANPKSAGSATQGSFKNLSASATGAGANVTVAADELVLEDSSGNYATAKTVSLTINTAGAGANGLDTGTLAGSTWYSLWVIRKPDGTTAGLISTSATTPTLPSGYTYKARVGWIRTDGTGNKYPLAFKQYGRSVQYVVAAGTNVTAVPVMASGTAGSVTAPTWVAVGVSNYVPLTAAAVEGILNSNGAGLSSAAPNNAFGPMGSATNPAPVGINSAGASGQSLRFRFVLESSNIYWAAQTAAGTLACLGWEDNI